MTVRDLILRARAVLAPNRVERDLRDELEFHIDRETRKLIDQGMSPKDAALAAQARFGSITVAADECRDQRGTAVLDHAIGDIHYALRTFKRAPLAAATIVCTVAIGLGLIGVLFTVLNMLLFRVDHVPDIHEMFTVARPQTEQASGQPLTLPLFNAMRQETKVFSGMYAEITGVGTRVDGRMLSGSVVTGSFFHVLGVHAIQGRTLLPEDDEREEARPVVVLSHEGWRTRFDSDPQIVGRPLIVNGRRHEIIGVMPEGFRGLQVTAPDYWAPMSMLADHWPRQLGREHLVGVEIAGRLRPGLSQEVARGQLEAWDVAQSTTRHEPGPSRMIELLPRRGTIEQPIEAAIVFTPLFFAFGLILLIGCANVANLLLARGVTRQNEIGIRLSLGASRRRLIHQLLTESLLLSLSAAVLGFFIAQIALDAAIAIILRSLPLDIANVALTIPGPDWRVALFMAAGAVIATALFGVMPALQATRIDPMQTLRGELIKDTRPGRARSLLIGLQVAASALLLVCSAIFLRSSFASTTIDPGFRTADTIMIDVPNEPKRAVTVQAVTEDPSVVAAGALWPPVLGSPRAVTLQSPSIKLTAGYRLVAPAYFEILDIPIRKGRGFSAAEATGQLPVAIINETLAATLFPGTDAVGQSIQLEPDPDSRTRRDDEPPLRSRAATVIGVSKDVPGFRISDVREANLYLPVNASVAGTSLIARVHGDPDRARQTLLDRLVLVDPHMGQILTMRTMASLETYFLRMAFWATLVLGGLALALTGSGLFSVLSYLVEQRTREIGVRMALGATTRNVTRLVIAQTARPVAIGLLCGSTLVLGLSALLLATPAGALIGEIIHVLDPLAYLGSLIVIVIACLVAAAVPASRASKVDPMRSLRQE